MERVKTSHEVEYDTANARRVLGCLQENIRGLTITDIADRLNLNRHTVTKILERMLLEKKVNYDEKGPAKIFYAVGKGKFVGRIDQGPWDKIWIDVVKPRYEGEERFVKLNQTKHDHLIRTPSKWRSVGAIAIRESQLPNLIRILRDVARKEFGLEV
jgi:predicted transcriptional regulator